MLTATLELIQQAMAIACQIEARTATTDKTVSYMAGCIKDKLHAAIEIERGNK